MLCCGRDLCAKPVCSRASPLVGTDCCVWKPLYYGDEGHSEQHRGLEDAVHDLGKFL